MCKKDTTFGQMIENAARKIYGDDFEFKKCIIEKVKNYNVSWSGYLPEHGYYVVTFVLENHPKEY